MFKSPNNRTIGFTLPGISETPQVTGGGGFFITDVEMAVPNHARSPHMTTDAFPPQIKNPEFGEMSFGHLASQPIGEFLGDDYKKVD